ncbi:hypothetical protein GIB67_033688 [Kingdonia uniflora]|uniref:AT-hook motif nuclear-localized protein n=1 Tax=Kingdonia uniflora TaxID=39325 RepID=A0A7J7P3Y0_9MAGN|nr:hypothetical protein GIB67_033688 [Kingdonia uniflora]
MSGSEAGIMSGRDSFSMGLPKNPVHSQSSGTPNMRLGFSSDGTPIYKPVIANSPQYQGGAGGGESGVGGGVGGGGGSGQIVPHGISTNMGSDSIKRKRGRPRKYGPDGTMALALTTGSVGVPNSGGFSSSSPASPPSLFKKVRGRPPGSGKKQQLDALVSVSSFLSGVYFAGTSGSGFTPYVITVKAGEDVASKIMSFPQHGRRAVCILTANGAISNVTLRQAATSGGTVTYEGRFEILSLSGSFLLSESGGQRSRSGGLSVSLAGPDGRVLGGGVAGILTAASPVQVTLGSFNVDVPKESKSNRSEPSSAPMKLVQGSGMMVGSGSPPSRGTMSESSGGPGSPLNQSSGACDNNNQHMMGNMPWK